MEAVTRQRGRPDAFEVLTAPVTILLGHFGSGKSEIAVNLAAGFAARGESPTLVDLDVVKPYFRCRQAKEELDALGVTMVVPSGDRFFADLPIVVPEVRGAVSGEGRRVIIDVGGDDLGARALGSVADRVDAGRTELLFVVNTRRPFAESTPAIVSMLRQIEGASHLRITGLVANTHLMQETTPNIVVAGVSAARDVEAATGIRVRFAACLAELVPVLDPVVEVSLPLLPIERRLLPPEVAGRRRPGHRPLGI